MRACLKDGKTYATCRPLVRQKLRQSKSWDNRTKTKTEVIVTNDENEKVNCALVRVAFPSDHPCCAAEVIATNDENENDAKSKVSKALNKSKKTTSKAIKVLKKNRTTITLALAVFAFRCEK